MVTVVTVDFSRSADPALKRVGYKIPQFFLDSGIPLCEENLYLREKALYLSEKSTKTEAEHLKETVLWRLSVGKKLIDFTDDDLEYFIDALCDYLKPSGCGLSWNTVNSRVSGAYRFFLWCKKKEYSPDITEEVSKNHKYRSRANYKRKGHPARQLEKATKFLLLDTAVELIRAIGNESAVSNHARFRNCLIAKLMLQCGLRLSEAVNFPISDLPETNVRGHSTPARVVGKGDKERFILIPNRLLADLWEYVDLTRAKIIEQLQGRLDLPVALRLFICNQGRGISGNWIEKIFARAGNSIGVKAVPHALRHTFGTYHYLHNKNLLFLSQLMGHESESTTEKLYVHTARLISHSGDYEQLQFDIDRLCAEITL